VKIEKGAKLETHTLGPGIWQETLKTCKMRNCRTWNMARKMKIMENEKHTLKDVKYGQKHCKTR
jgi:hypothetical protein